MPGDMSKDEGMLAAMGGRTIDEEIEWIRKYKNQCSPEELKTKLLGAMEIEEPKPKAENMVLMGCYALFREPLSVRNYFMLLKRLGIDFTYPKEELCCGLVSVEIGKGEERKSAEKAAREFMEANLAQAKKAGAKNAVYLCVWCAYLARRFFPDSPIAQMHYPDILLEKLSKEKMRVKPKVIGYYEGCHRRNKRFAPGVDLEWDKYREVLNNIEGLKVVKMPDHLCCVDLSDRIMGAAQELNVDTIVCSCRACYSRLRHMNKGKLRFQYYTDLLLEALTPDYVSID